ncbi:ABC transporter substrate-binding protein [Flexivirga sp. ID2601S]|uniref:ABC transporter substrate-binding protein n=1 Tax=Flexivirga aerilata TaxID=1656889 RepID=A0A849AGZ8_9MICO|nr:ABC transporter substrate-binding protein [Flexivirga aerilata]NNG39137.1 ABC transporter substrate-binding protein [Flexivirga aerilata]
MAVTKPAAAVALVAASALTLSACASSKRSDSNASGGAKGNTNATLNFGAAGAPGTLDPFYASDGETFRVSRQMFQGLTGFKPGTAEVAPALATSWTPSSDGKTWTFKLKTGVKFHDGTPFNADAVCKNFKRMDSQNAAGQQASEYWLTNMGGYNGAKGELYQGCTAKDASTVEIKIARPTSKFPALLGLPAFSMQSPTALDKYKANDIKAQGEGFVYPAYANAHPVGTGPMKFQAYDKTNKTVTLVRNDDYAGDEKPTIAKLVFQIIPDETARKQALSAGTIDGYDLPNPVDWPALKKDDNLEIRPAFNILYLGLNSKVDPNLKDLKVRQALYYAINRDQLVKSLLPSGASVATQFMPKTVAGYNDSLQPYKYDPAKAKQLLSEAGKSGMSITLWYPTEVSRPYMPAPDKIFNAIKANWEAVGIKVTPKPLPWAGGYVTQTQNGKASAYLMGWTGDYDTPDNFLGSFFSDPKGQMTVGAYPWGATFVKDLSDADSIVDESARAAKYETINKQVMEQYLPGLPISSSPPAIVFSKKVSGVTPSPLTDEHLWTAKVDK